MTRNHLHSHLEMIRVSTATVAPPWRRKRPRTLPNARRLMICPRSASSRPSSAHAATEQRYCEVGPVQQLTATATREWLAVDDEGLPRQRLVSSLAQRHERRD
jgi:hypothetical protein